MNKVSIRFGIKQSGWFPNAGIFVRNVTKTDGDNIIQGVETLRVILQTAGMNDIASKLVAEYR